MIPEVFIRLIRSDGGLTVVSANCIYCVVFRPETDTTYSSCVVSGLIKLTLWQEDAEYFFAAWSDYTTGVLDAGGVVFSAIGQGGNRVSLMPGALLGVELREKDVTLYFPATKIDLEVESVDPYIELCKLRGFPVEMAE